VRGKRIKGIKGIMVEGWGGRGREDVFEP